MTYRWVEIFVFWCSDSVTGARSPKFSSTHMSTPKLELNMPIPKLGLLMVWDFPG